MANFYDEKYWEISQNCCKHSLFRVVKTPIKAQCDEGIQIQNCFTRNIILFDSKPQRI